MAPTGSFSPVERVIGLTTRRFIETVGLRGWFSRCLGWEEG